MSAAITVTDLVKRYRRADRNAVDGISFQVEDGEFFTLLGPNGAGKTTTISILTTTLRPTGGTVTIAGHDVVAHPERVRREAGIIFQNPSVDKNLTGEENVRFHAILYGVYPWRPIFRMMPTAYRQQVTALADLVGLGEDMFRPIKKYSGGMRRKLEIVRGLMHRPRVLFLDEPTTGLDAAARRDLWEYIAQVRRDHGTTVVLTTHYLDEAEDSDRTCILDRGRIAALGRTDDLRLQLDSEYLVLDAEDRPALVAELAGLGLAATGEPPFRVQLVGRRPQDVVQALRTPLSVMRTHAPSLEDAYLRLVGRDA